MPTTYAHDLFGKNVYRKLPQDMKAVIRKNGDLYRIGLHGPDILFYLMMVPKVPELGTAMHKERAGKFFERGMAYARKTQNRPLLAYLLGFGCHYLLDSACHPFVNRVADEGVISHTLLEKEFDRSLMLETGRNPYHFYPSDCIVPKERYANVIHLVIPQVSVRNIERSLFMMKILTNAMVYDDHGRKNRLMKLLAKPAGAKHARVFLEHFMEKDPIPGCEKPVQELQKLFDEALAEAPNELPELYRLWKKGGHLSERWNRTYNG